MFLVAAAAERDADDDDNDNEMMIMKTGFDLVVSRDLLISPSKMADVDLEQSAVRYWKDFDSAEIRVSRFNFDVFLRRWVRFQVDSLIFRCVVFAEDKFWWFEVGIAYRLDVDRFEINMADHEAGHLQRRETERLATAIAINISKHISTKTDPRFSCFPIVSDTKET